MRARYLVLAAVLFGCSSTSPPVDGASPDVTPGGDSSPGSDAALDGLPGGDVVGTDAPGADVVGADTGVRPPTVLRVHYPAGTHSVAVRGSSGPLNWNSGLRTTAGAEDTYTFTTDAISEATEWKPLLDDATWSRGPNYRVMPGQTVDVYPHFNTTAGRVYRFIPTFHSSALGNDRTVWAYLPPTYVENSRATFPVVYMHDGQNLFDPAMAFGGNEWQVDETMDTAAEDGSIAEAVVIAPENTAARIDEYTPTPDASVGGGGRGDLYLQMLVNELRPQVESMLRVRRGPENTAILGSSLGGLISAYAGLTHAEAFGLIGAMSPSTWWDNEVIIADVMMSRGHTPRALRVYLDSGDSGPSMDDVTQTTALTQAYVGVGYAEGRDLLHVVQAGASHNEYYWAQRLPGALRFLLGPGR